MLMRFHSKTLRRRSNRMTSLRVYKGLLQSVIQVPPSKSYANRLLILAALKSTPFIIHNLPMAEDVQFLVQCLNKLGLAITKNSNSVTVTGSFPACESEDLSLDVGEGGTTARFL